MSQAAEHVQRAEERRVQEQQKLAADAAAAEEEKQVSAARIADLEAEMAARGQEAEAELTARQQAAEADRLAVLARLEDTLEQQLVCAACLELPVHPVVLNCSHSYCWLCLGECRRTYRCRLC
jgi:hypothetical protein